MSRFSGTILIISTLLLIGQIISIIFLDSDVAVGHVAFQLFENLLMIIVTLVPVTLGKTINVQMPKAMETAFVGFCFASLVMGDLLDFYGRFPWWDMVLHGISGTMLGILGYAIFSILNANVANVPPLCMPIWIICFAMASGAMWEIWEYATDGIFGLNSQEFLTSSGTFDHAAPLLGRAALKDTMEDLILDLAGSAIIAIPAYFGMRRKSAKQPDKHQEGTKNSRNRKVPGAYHTLESITRSPLSPPQEGTWLRR